MIELVCEVCGHPITKHGCTPGRVEVTDLILNPNKTVYYPTICRRPR